MDDITRCPHRRKRHRCRDQAVAKRHHRFAVVEHHAELEAVLAGSRALPDPFEVSGGDPRSRFDLDADDLAGAVLDH
jgi:hypothetical protein